MRYTLNIHNGLFLFFKNISIPPLYIQTIIFNPISTTLIKKTSILFLHPYFTHISSSNQASAIWSCRNQKKMAGSLVSSSLASTNLTSVPRSRMVYENSTCHQPIRLHGSVLSGNRFPNIVAESRRYVLRNQSF